MKRYRVLTRDAEELLEENERAIKKLAAFMAKHSRKPSVENGRPPPKKHHCTHAGVSGHGSGSPPSRSPDSTALHLEANRSAPLSRGESVLRRAKNTNAPWHAAWHSATWARTQTFTPALLAEVRSQGQFPGSPAAGELSKLDPRSLNATPG